MWGPATVRPIVRRPPAGWPPPLQTPACPLHPAPRAWWPCNSGRRRSPCCGRGDGWRRRRSSAPTTLCCSSSESGGRFGTIFASGTRRTFGPHSSSRRQPEASWPAASPCGSAVGDSAPPSRHRGSGAASSDAGMQAASQKCGPQPCSCSAFGAALWRAASSGGGETLSDNQRPWRSCSAGRAAQTHGGHWPCCVEAGALTLSSTPRLVFGRSRTRRG